MHFDLSHVITDGLVTYKGLPAPIICDYLSREDSRANYDEGTEFQIGKIEMVANTGTYIDVPSHRYADGDDLSQVSLDRLAGLPVTLVDQHYSDGLEVGADLFEGKDIAGRAVLIHTSWSDHWNTERYYEGHPYLTEEAAVLLRDQGARMVGIDTYNIDDTTKNIRPVHSVLLGSGIPIVEHMNNLGELPLGVSLEFTAAPPRIAGMGSFPVRAFARTVE